MDKKEVKESKILFWLGVVLTVVCLVLFVVTLIQAPQVSVVFLLFAFVCSYLILAYFKRRIVYDSNGFAVLNVFKKKKEYRYSEIDFVCVTAKTTDIRIVIFGKDDKRLAVFENNMYGSDEFVAYLKEKNINIYSADELREKGKDIDKNLKWFEKTNNTTQKTVEESAKYSAKKFGKESVLKQKKIVKVIGWVLLALNVVAFLFLKGKTELSVYILTIFTIWFMYIILYPKMFLEIPAVSKKSRDYVIEMPFLAGGVSLLFCVGTVDMFEYATKEYIAYFFVLTALLVLPFLIKVFSLKEKSKPSRVLCVVFMSFVISFTTLLPLNYILTFQDSVHKTVEVVDMNESRSGKSGTDYDITVITDGEEKTFGVSKNFYKSIDEGDTVRLCKNKSLFGFDYMLLHT